MNNDTVDLLKIKIETAKRELPVETLNAINAIDWRVAILGMRDKHGYNFEQLGDLELETELVLCGLVSPEDYPKELEKRMGISPAAVNELMNEMNDLVFKKIREEFIKNTERKKLFQKNEMSNEASKAKDTNDTKILNSAGIKIIHTSPPGGQASLPSKESWQGAGGENKETLPIPNLPMILSQKLSSPVQIPIIKTEYSLPNIQPSAQNETVQKNKVDPYREIPE